MSKSAIPEPQIDNFSRLYRKVQCSKNLRSSDVQAVVPTAERDAAISLLDELRDEFLHFNVKGWSIDVAQIRESAPNCAQIASFLVSQPGSVLWHDGKHEQRTKNALSLLQEQLA
jgi:hypothetical protein